MPHVIVKLWPGKTEEKKKELAVAIAEQVTKALEYGDASVSVSFEEVDADRWREEVYIPDIVNKPDRLYKKPGYKM
ncbi:MULTISPECIES: tautomerase family protein [unclassified Hyphomicrobium]|uniref:tautomerase family protein n=1 Tax=unclassified Hyphomicrobium TaxID=2619925 RepID=UPI000213E485|nr:MULTISPECIES: tautomerase family protein [unclassified Hyphomicrobium]CCB67130.1 Tautomerase pptA [Hyphomicrobium sp. MC1]